MSAHSPEVAQNLSRLLAFFSAKGEPVGFADAVDAMGWSNSMAKRYMYLLVDDGLIERVTVRSRKQVSTYALTNIGRGVAAGRSRSWAARGGDTVPAPTFTTLGRGRYQSNTQAYYRNSGNAHIASHGVSC